MGLFESITRTVRGAFRREAYALPLPGRDRVPQMFGAGPEQIGSAMKGALEGDQNAYLDLCAIFARFYQTDAHLSGEVDKFVREASKWPWNVEAADDDPQGEEIAEACEAAIRAIPRFRSRVLKQWARGYFFGRAFVELDGTQQNGAWSITAARGRPAWSMRKKDDGGWETKTKAGWVDVPTGKVLVFTVENDGDDITAGLMWQLVWLALFKNFTLKDWQAFLEVYGVPMRVASVPDHVKPGSVDWETAATAALNAASDSGVVLNSSIVLEFKEALKGQTVDAFEKSARFWNGEMSKRIVGGTLVSDAGKRGEGAQSLGEVQQDEKFEITKPAAEELAEAFTEAFVKMWVVAHYGERPAYPVFAFTIIRTEDLNKETATIFGFMDRGTPIKLAAIYDRFMEWARPDEGDDVLVAEKPENTGTPAQGGAPLRGVPDFQAQRGVPEFRILKSRASGLTPLSTQELDSTVLMLDGLAESADAVCAPILGNFVDVVLNNVAADGSLVMTDSDAAIVDFHSRFVDTAAPLFSALITAGIAHTLIDGRREGIADDVLEGVALGAVRGVSEVLGVRGQGSGASSFSSSLKTQASGLRPLALFDTGGIEIANWSKIVPQRALEFFRSLVGVTSDHYEALDKAARAVSFTLARVESERVITTAKSALERAIADGTTERDFRKSVNEALSAEGYDPLNPWRSKQVFTQNVLTSYSAGRRTTQTEPGVAALMPYGRWMSLQVGEFRRPAHIRLHGTTLPIGDPFFDSYTPPQGFGCKCRIESAVRVRAGAPTAVPPEIEAQMGEGFTNSIAAWNKMKEGQSL